MQWGRHGQLPGVPGAARYCGCCEACAAGTGRDTGLLQLPCGSGWERLGAVRGNGAEAGGYDQPMVCPGAAVAAEAAMVATAAAVARRRQSMGEALF